MKCKSIGLQTGMIPNKFYNTEMAEIETKSAFFTVKKTIILVKRLVVQSMFSYANSRTTNETFAMHASCIVQLLPKRR